MRTIEERATVRNWRVEVYAPDRWYYIGYTILKADHAKACIHLALCRPHWPKGKYRIVPVDA